MKNEFGLRISPSVCLENLLRQYPSGGQFLSEALQNAEDTYRATKFCALLDLRSHLAQRARPPKVWRERLHGPAILFFDNGGFEDRDWKSLQNIYRSEKRQSPHEAGMYGMGSRSFFHIGDVLQVVSRKTFATLDPDERVTESGGEKINFVDDQFSGQHFADAYPDECAPFVGVFGCNMRDDLQGTIIRVALRGEGWAKESNFMKEPFSVERAEKLFHDFEKTLSNGKIVLFLARVTCAELWRWGAAASSPERVARACLGVSSGHQVPEQPSSMGSVRAFLKQFDTFHALQQKLLGSLENELPKVHDVVSITSCVGGCNEVKTTWLRYGGFFMDPEQLKLVSSCSTVPVVVLALSLDGPCKGNAFTFLPLPIETGLPVHIHASFRLLDNRRGLWRHAPDLEGEHVFWAQWNENVVNCVVPKFYASALECLANDPSQAKGIDGVYAAWPRLMEVRQAREGFTSLLHPFVEAVRQLPVLLTHDEHWVSPNMATFIKTSTRALSKLRRELLALCCTAKWRVVDPPNHVVELLCEHRVLNVRNCMEVLLEVIIPRARSLNKQLLAKVMLAILEHAGQSLQDQAVRDLGRNLADVSWVPTADGETRAVCGTFCPDCRLPDLGIVAKSRANIAEYLTDLGLDRAAVLHAMRLCGMKVEITWEDAAAEAKSVEHEVNLARAQVLYEYVESHHQWMHGSRDVALQSMGNANLSWVPAIPADPNNAGGTVLHPLAEIFPPSAKALVWAVAPCLRYDRQPMVLQPRRSIATEPGVLTRQVAVLAAFATGSPPSIPRTIFKHMSAAFDELGRQERVQELLSSLCDTAYMPCDGADERNVVLFRPRFAALSAQQGHQQLSPAIGVVINDPVARCIAKAAGVPSAPAAQTLAEQLQEATGDLAVALALELAGRLLSGTERRPANIRVPTRQGTVDLALEVYIDDAPWQGRDDLKTLDPRIGPDQGRALGCTSVRDELARLCQGAAAAEADAFGQEADLVDQVAQLLQEYHARADVVTEFVQNTDDSGAEQLVFHLRSDTFGRERIVDSRAAALQGPALYICSSKQLAPEDIKRMQRVGRSEKRLDFNSTGRFGVGMNVMYRYSDCPQLAANGRLHFFDLDRSFVARESQAKRGMVFEMSKLRDSFPDSLAPFELDRLTEEYPVVFRLALRTKRSQLGEIKTLESVSGELAEVAKDASRMLLFTRHLKSLTFHQECRLLAKHECSVQDQPAYDAFFAGVPKTLAELQSDSADMELHAVKSIKSTISGGCVSPRDWLIAHRVTRSSALLELVKDIYEQPHGTALLPHGAAAAIVGPDTAESELSSGRVCSGLPSSVPSGSRAWIHGTFVWTSSRRSMPLPDGPSPSPQQKFNLLLLEGPVAHSLRDVILAVRGHLQRSEPLADYFSLFPRRAGPFQTFLAAATFAAGLQSEIFPVITGDGGRLRWTSGPRPLMRVEQLSEAAQNSLATDGLDLVSLPPDLIKEYKAVISQQQQARLHAESLCSFLASKWRELHGAAVTALPLSESRMAALSQRDGVLELLQFAVSSDWESRAARHNAQGKYTFEQLRGVPLLLTHGQTVTTFGNPMFETGHSVLPDKPRLFVDRGVTKAMRSGMDLHLPEVIGHVAPDFKAVGIQPLKLWDLQLHRGDVERAVEANSNFSDPNRSQVLRSFWDLVGKEGASSPVWRDTIRDWRVLPVYTQSWTAAVAPMDRAGSCVAVEWLQVADDTLRNHIASALLTCGVPLLQGHVLSEERIRKKLSRVVVCSDSDMLALLVLMHREDGVIDRLPGADRHHLLAYLSVLCVSNIPVGEAGQLPLFKQAQGDAFTALQPDKKYCCIHPSDPHAQRLAMLMPPNAVLLAWPTNPIKPLYEHLGVELCSGEHFMVTFVVPQLPTICRQDADGSASRPCLELLEDFVLNQESDKVDRLARQTEFIPAQDGSTMNSPSMCVDPAGKAASQFPEVLSSSTPVQWMQPHKRVLRHLGMSARLSPDQLLRCAKHLHSLAGVPVDNAMRVKSFELVEELALALSQRPTESGTEIACEEQHPLIMAAACRVLVVKRLAASSVGEEVGRLAAISHRECADSSSGFSLELAPFRNVAFQPAVPLLWTVRPVEYHRHPVSSEREQRRQMEHFVQARGNWMHDRLGAFVVPEKLAADLVLQHLQQLLQNLPAQDAIAELRADSVLHWDLQACWRYFGAQLALAQGPASLNESLCFLGQQGWPCVPVEGSDAADNPRRDTVQLAPARRCFEEISCAPTCAKWLLQYVNTTKRGMLRDHGEVFRALGQRKTMEADDYAAITARVAMQAAKMGGRLLTHMPIVIECCALGILDCIDHQPEVEVQARDLYLLAEDGQLAPAADLVWGDRFQWQVRCRGMDVLRFWKPIDGFPELAPALSACTGMRKLSSLVHEGVVQGSSTEGPNPHAEAVQSLVMSEEFAEGLLAAVVDSIHRSSATQRGSAPIGAAVPRPIEPELAQVKQWVGTVRFCGVSTDLQTALYWTSSPGQGGGSKIVPGSQKPCCTFYDASAQAIFIGMVHGGSAENFLKQLVWAFWFALPYQCSKVKRDHLWCMLKCACDGSGPLGIVSALADEGISYTPTKRDHILGPGDECPPELLDYLVLSMDESFREDEYIAVQRNEGIFIIARVLPWGGNAPDGNTLSRSYRICTSREGCEIRKHFELYKIQWNGQGGALRLSGDLVPSGEAHSVDDEPAGVDDASTFRRVKGQLREISHMPEQDYRAAMRRLYLTWHPDKAEDTPLAKCIFNLLRRHADWYKNRQERGTHEEDDWLDEEELEGSGPDRAGRARAEEEESPVPAPRAPAPGGQASWFDEFERERVQQQQARAQGQHLQPGGRGVQFVPQSRMTLWLEPQRIVDREQAECWLQQARVMLLTARKLVESPTGARAFRAGTVWHCEQVVEMGIKSAMLRTCGITMDELKGTACHDLPLIVSRLRGAIPITREQQRAQDMPIGNADLEWLKHAYIDTRYPKLGCLQVPAHSYGVQDAERALTLAEDCLMWAANLEDLPDPGTRMEESEEEEEEDGLEAPPPLAAPPALGPRQQPPPPAVAAPPRREQLPQGQQQHQQRLPAQEGPALPGQGALPPPPAPELGFWPAPRLPLAGAPTILEPAGQ